MTAAEALRRFRTHMTGERNASAHTTRAYGADLAAFAAFCDGEGRPPSSWDRAFLRRYLARLGEARQARNTLLRRHASLRAFLAFLHREKILSSNPAAGLPSPKREKRLPGVLSEEEAAKLFASAPAGARDRAILELLYSAGFRASELAGLDVESVDFWEGAVRVLGKGGRERIVPVGRKAVDAVRAWLAERDIDPLSRPAGGAPVGSPGTELEFAL